MNIISLFNLYVVRIGVIALGLGMLSYASIGFAALTGPNPKPDIKLAEIAILKQLKKELKDPDSIKQFEMGKFELVDDMWVVCVKFNAKNSFGGYVGQKTYPRPFIVLQLGPKEVTSLGTFPRDNMCM